MAHILVVDDDKDLCAQLRAALERDRPGRGDVGRGGAATGPGGAPPVSGSPLRRPG